MPLPTPGLDDRTFQDIVDEAKRMIPRYCPEWTNHNVSDPGVALIELFAWMSEMVLYRVNQVPERLYTHFLNMVGIEPFPPTVSRTDLTFWLSAVLDAPVLVPANTEVMTVAGAADRTEPVVFSTVEELVIAPPALEAAQVVTQDGRAEDVWEELRYNPAGVAVFASSQLTPGDAFHLGFRDSLGGMVLRIAITAEAEGIGVDPRRPPLVWEVWEGEAWIPTQVYEDTTGGLNRAGEVVLMVPRGHVPMSVGNHTAYWLRARLLAPAAGQPTYKASPRVRGIDVAALGGTVTAEHAEVAPGEVIGRSDGGPGQVFGVSRTPVLPRRPDETVRVVHHDRTETWQEVGDFSQSGPDDAHFVWESGTGVIRFGPRVRYPDGGPPRQHGKVPPDGARIEVTSYRHGGGTAGNVGARSLTLLRTTLPFVSGVVNLAPATGGVDAETVAEAKVRGPLTLRTGQRAVTAGDYERLTLESSPRVARARCRAARGNGVVQLLVVPHVRGDVGTHRIDDYAISQSLMEEVKDHLDEHRVVGTAVEVTTPFYQGISVVARVYGAPGRPQGVVRQRATDALNRFVNPLTGGPQGEGWPFDADLNVATITQLLESVEGVDRVEEALLFEYDLRSGRRLGAAKDVVRLDRQSLFLSAVHQVVVR